MYNTNQNTGMKMSIENTIFLFNHDQKVEYRKWAKFLLPAEDWISSEKIRLDAKQELGF